MANIYILTVVLAVCSIGVQGQDVACGAALDASTAPGVITSANFPNYYPSSEDCTNVITASDPSQTIVLDISAFEVEYHHDCSYDYLEVFDGPDDSSPSLGKFCGNFTEDSEDAPQGVIESSGNALTLHFHSDSYLEESGYSATYQVARGDCWNQYNNTKYGGTKLARVYSAADAVTVCETLGCVAYTCHAEPEKKGCNVYSETSGEIAKNGRAKKWTSRVYGPCEAEAVEKREDADEN